MKKISLFGCILFCQLCGIAGTLSGSGDTLWYQSLEKPWFNPPSFVFAPVWTLLYGIMGYILWKLFYAPLSKERTNALRWFFLQLGLNVGWSFLFFGMEQILWAFVEILILLVGIGYTMYWCGKIEESLAYWFIPYLVWVSFATLLTGSLLMLN